MREVELKFGVHASFTVPVFEADATGVAEMEKLPIQELRSTYYDTEDLRLARNSITLRYRRGDETGPTWTLKLPVRGTSLAHRDEHDFEGTSRSIPQEIRDLVTAYTRGAPLDQVATIQTRRRRWALKTSEDHLLAELVDDEVSVLEARKVVSRFRELEIEARAATLDELERIAGALRASGATDLEPIPKAVRALGPRATRPPDPVVEPRPGPDRPAALAVQAAFARAVRRLIDHDPDTRLGDPEGVHQMRVATRRLRSDLRTFKTIVDPAWAGALAVDLKWLGRSLGGVRDHDVLLSRLHDAADDLEDDMKPLFHALEEERETARTNLLADLVGTRYVEMLNRLIEATVAPVFSERASGGAAETLLPAVAGAWKRLAVAARRLNAKSSDEEHHAVRVEAKRARYAAEALIDIFGKPAKRFAEAATEVQDVLGAHQDAIVARDRILELAKNIDGPPSFHVAAGRLAERQVQAAGRARARFPQVWEAVDRKKIKGWLTH